MISSCMERYNTMGGRERTEIQFTNGIDVAVTNLGASQEVMSKLLPNVQNLASQLGPSLQDQLTFLSGYQSSLPASIPIPDIPAIPPAPDFSDILSGVTIPAPPNQFGSIGPYNLLQSGVPTLPAFPSIPSNPLATVIPTGGSDSRTILTSGMQVSLPDISSISDDIQSIAPPAIESIRTNVPFAPNANLFNQSPDFTAIFQDRNTGGSLVSDMLSKIPQVIGTVPNMASGSLASGNAATSAPIRVPNSNSSLFT